MVTDAASADATTADLRLGFAGTPEFAARVLQALVAAGRTPLVVYTQPDRPVGRGRRVQPSPVKTLAAGHGLPVRQPMSLRGAEAADALDSWRLDVLIVAAYGLILPPAVLTLPALGCINVHASLLPRWRGAAPVERAIMAGDTETGVCIMQMERGLDTGPVYLCRRTPIADDTDAPALEARLAQLGGEALLECLDRLPNLAPVPQPEDGVTYAHKLTRADAEVDWSQPATLIDRQIRALRGRMPPVAAAADVRVTLLAAHAEDTATVAAPGTVVSADSHGICIACGSGVLRVLELRLNVGKGRPLRAADAVNGYADLFRPGTRLSKPPAS